MNRYLFPLLILLSAPPLHVAADEHTPKQAPRFGDGVRGIQYIPRDSYQGTYIGFTMSVATEFEDLANNAGDLGEALLRFNEDDISTANQNLFDASNFGLQSITFGYLSPRDPYGLVGGVAVEIGRRTVSNTDNRRFAITAASIFGQIGYRDPSGDGFIFSLNYGAGFSPRVSGGIEFTEFNLGPITSFDGGDFLFRLSGPIQCSRSFINCKSLGRISFDLYFSIE